MHSVRMTWVTHRLRTVSPRDLHGGAADGAYTRPSVTGPDLPHGNPLPTPDGGSGDTT
jgi:hypothetical protein